MKSFLSPKYIEHEVNGEIHNFYPVSLQVAFQVKNILRPLVTGLAQIMTDTDGLEKKGYTTTKQTDPKTGEVFEQSIINPVSIEIHQWRAKEKEKAILDFLEAFTEKKSTNVLCRIIMDSMRDDFDRRIEQKEVDDFSDSIDADVFAQLLVGVVKANKGIFGPFGESLKSMAKLMGDRLQTKLRTEPESLSREEDSEKTIGDTSAQSSIFSSPEDTPTVSS